MSPRPRFHRYTIAELADLPRPVPLVANAIETADLIAGSGDLRFWANIDDLLGAGVIFLEDRADTFKSRVGVIVHADTLRREAPAPLAPAVVIYCDARSRNWEFYSDLADVVVEALSPTFARVIKLRRYPNLNKVVRIHDGKVIVEELGRPDLKAQTPPTSERS